MLGIAVSLCVCLGLTQLIQCREYRFAVKVSTCNNLPSKNKMYHSTVTVTGAGADAVYVHSTVEVWVTMSQPRHVPASQGFMGPVAKCPQSLR